MATLALATAGATVGGMLGGPAGAQAGFLAGTILGTILFPPDPIRGPRLSDLKISASTYGKPFPICYGTMRIGGNMIWGKEIKEKEVEEGGGFGKAGAISYRYFGNFAIAFTEGPIEAVTRVWADGKLILDLTSGGTAFSDALISEEDTDYGSLLDEGKVKGVSLGKVRLYYGTETQLPDPWIQADKGVDDTPAYRGLSYIVFQRLPLEDYGNRNPQITAEISCNATVAYPTDTMDLNFNPQAAGFHPNDQHIYVSGSVGGTAYKIDALSMKVITSAPLGVDLWPAFNFAGDIFGSKQVNAGARFYRFDGDTFALLAQSDDILNGSFAGLFVGDVDITSFGRLIFTGLSPLGNIGVWDGVKPDGINSQYDTNIQLHGVAVDIEDRAWVLGVGSGASPTGATVFQVDPYTAVPVAQYDIPGHDNIQIGAPFYDPVTDSIYWLTAPPTTLVRFRLDTLTVDATVTVGGGSVFHNEGAIRNGPYNGRIWLSGSNADSFTEVDLVSMTSIRTVTNDPSTWNLPAGTARPIYSPRQHALITTGNYWLYLDRATGAATPLSDIVDDISERVNIGAAERSTSALTDQVYGYFLGSRATARQHLEPLQSAYFFDARESDWTAEFIKRGGAVVASIPEDDLGAVATPDGTAQASEIEETRGQELELPERIDVTYPDVSIDHQTMTQHAKRAREAIKTRDLVEIGLPIAFEDGDEPAQIAEKALYSAYAERTRYGISLSWSHIRLDPADPITVTREDTSFRTRLVQGDWEADGVLQLKGVSEDPSTYTSFKTGATADGFIPQVIEQTGPTALQLMDSPLWRDVDEAAGPVIRIGCGGYGSGNWPGAQVYRSNDGVDFSDGLAFVASDGNMTWGSAATVLADGTTTVWDTVNSVTLRLVRGSLSSSTRLSVLNGANTIQIGDEIVQFVTVVDNGDDTVTISDLLRGQRGTEWAASGHILNDRVVLLTSGTVVNAEVGSDEVSKTRTYKAVTIGGSFSNADAKSLAFLGRSKMPLSPVHIKSTVASETWTITWVRRTRLGGQWQDGVDVPLSETSEGYEVDILDGSTVVRTITTTASANGSVVTAASRQAVYNTADVAADFGSPTPTSLTVKIYQLATQGRGFSGDATLLAA